MKKFFEQYQPLVQERWLSILVIGIFGFACIALYFLLPFFSRPGPPFCDALNIADHIARNELIFSGESNAWNLPDRDRVNELDAHFGLEASGMRRVVDNDSTMEHRVYPLADNAGNIGQTIAKINEFYKDQHSEGLTANEWIFVDFNYLTYSPYGLPDGGDGDPLGYIYELDTTLLPHREPLNNPSEIWVTIFDTSPYPQQTGLVSVNLPSDPVFPNFDIQVEDHLGALGSIQQATGSSNNEHGVFIAGLIDHEAPEVNLELVRVLNDAGEGDLFTLIEALTEYRNSLPPSHKNVINLSLGIGDYRQSYFKPGGFSGLNTACNPGISIGLENAIRAKLQAHLQTSGSGSTPLDLMALRIIIQDLINKDVVVVAAAGNDSAGIPYAETKPTQAPASFYNVIAVGSSNHENAASCFSNIGYVYAFGGDSTSKEGKCYEKTLEELYLQCQSAPTDPNPNCPYWVTSITSSGNTAIWHGSSFSSATVSGLAARMLDAGCPARYVEFNIWDTSNTYTNSGTSYPIRIIDMVAAENRAKSGCLPPP